MASGFIGNEVPRKGLRVRVPCPPLSSVPAGVPGFDRSDLTQRQLASFFYRSVKAFHDVPSRKIL